MEDYNNETSTLELIKQLADIMMHYKLYPDGLEGQDYDSFIGPIIRDKLLQYSMIIT